MKLAEQLRKLADEAENQKKTVLPKLAPINLQEAVDELQQVLGRVYTPIELRLEGSLGGTMKAKWSIWDGKNYQKGETLAEAVFAVHKSREPPKANVLAETEIALTPPPATAEEIDRLAVLEGRLETVPVPDFALDL